MKTLLVLISTILLASGDFLGRPASQVKLQSLSNTMAESSFYDFKLKDINGKEVDFSEFKGKKLLLVNVASKCGYTKQYAQLQELYAEHGDKITILGFPANNFGGQEPGSNEEIKEFCSTEYGVTFPMFEKISVAGFDKHPLYRWLSDASKNGWNNEEPNWNFCKYFVNEKGELVKFFPSAVTPLDEEILKLIEA
ncbi:glutathione peroxidase [Algoriphagus aestuariicola]|jgi:glutathione peroxidase|uniref:Glutathione peroxidase n=1 Tax=Algoriphagus aestuariicola TaxID=1852016 RepID=A0ABS3BNT6_9BACT|nr:glutathione peroxidase [Algoriphagus aestuariicola]MBN7800964.1 glutathione peroxidase [Algoriphagus aestuariicola]